MLASVSCLTYLLYRQPTIGTAHPGAQWVYKSFPANRRSESDRL